MLYIQHYWYAEQVLLDRIAETEQCMHGHTMVPLEQCRMIQNSIFKRRHCVMLTPICIYSSLFYIRHHLNKPHAPDIYVPALLAGVLWMNQLALWAHQPAVVTK